MRHNLRFLLVSFWEPGHPEFMAKTTLIQNQIAKWEIPFMNTTIDFTTGNQDIKQEQTYGNINFELVNILDRVFVYKITTLNSEPINIEQI